MSEAVPVLLEPGEGQTIRSPLGGDLIVKLANGETGGSLTMFESTAGPGEGPPLHIHANEAEVVYVLEGTLRFKIGDEVVEVQAGGFAFVPRGLRHTWQNAGAEHARLLITFVPASPGMERFFFEFAGLPEDAPFQEEFARLGSEAGMEVVGPPLAPSDSV
jgi:quercetin dioxygenase-like cupin family protein